MINHGHIDLDITHKDLEALEFSDYFQCYQQTPETEIYYNK